MKSFKQFINEGTGLSAKDKRDIADAVKEDLKDDPSQDVHELVGMYLENYSGGEMAGEDEIKEIAKMAKK